MSVPILVITNSFIPEYLFTELKKRGSLKLKRDLSPEEFEKAKQEAEIIIASGGSKFKKEDYDSCPNLKLITDFGVGYDGIDINEANLHQVLVSHTPNVLNDDVADLALAHTLNITRNLVNSHNYAKAGIWEQEGAFPLATNCHHQKVGLVGLGRIGLEIAHRAEAFKMKVSYYARHPKDVPYCYYDNLEEMAKNVEILILAIPASKETFHLIDKKILKALGPQGFLINIARGSIVNTSDLKYALTHNIIKAAAIDVFENEPNVDKELVAMDNVVAYPHVGSATVQTRKQMADLCILNIDLFIKGQELKSKVV